MRYTIQRRGGDASRAVLEGDEAVLGHVRLFGDLPGGEAQGITTTSQELPDRHHPRPL